MGWYPSVDQDSRILPTITSVVHPERTFLVMLQGEEEGPAKMLSAARRVWDTGAL